MKRWWKKHSLQEMARQANTYTEGENVQKDNEQVSTEI